MAPIDIQVSRSKVSVEGQTYSLYVGEGGISVLQTSISYVTACFYLFIFLQFQHSASALRKGDGFRALSQKKSNKTCLFSRKNILFDT